MSFKTLVDEVIEAFNRYANACRAAIDMPLDTRRWTKIAAICDENARAWTNLAALYREGIPDERSGESGSADRPSQ